MPNLKLTDLASFRAYFEGLATAHKDIAGFKFGDTDVIRNDNRSDLSENFLWAMPYDNARYTGVHADNILKVKRARVAFMKVRESEKFADVDADFQYCEAIIEQIVAKIFKDKRGELIGNDWSMLVANVATMTTGPVEKKIGSTPYIGWELAIDISENANLVYDETKWNS